MRKRGAYAVLAGAALFMTCTLSFTAFAKEERTPVGKIKLNFTSDIQAGEIGGNVDVSLEDGECSIESVDIVNEGDSWVGGDKPKVEIWLSADSDYYFKKSGKSAFSFSGDTVKYVSSSTKNDKEEMVLVVRLDKLDEDDEDLDVSGLMWDEDNGVAHWDDMSLEELAQTFAESGYSRLPVYHDTVDNIIGVVHEKDFYIARLKKSVTMEDLIAPTLYTTGSTQISQLLRTLREQHHHMAVVVDEYGGTEGIITLEDILEELVGEIWDEHDEATEDFRQQSDGSWLVSGSASVDDLYETLGLPEDEDIDSNTVNGLVQEKTHHLPKVGDHFQLNDYEGVVTRTARRRVTEVRFTHTAPAPQDDEKDKDKRSSRLAQRTEGR